MKHDLIHRGLDALGDMMSAAEIGHVPISEIGHVPISEIGHVPISEIRVSGENDRIYRRINPSDPAIKTLANSIAAKGVLEPLVLSEDGYLLSGHRRLAASKLAGLTVIPCRVDPGVWKDGPEFLTRLREYNRQRSKGVDEIFRENMVDAAASDVEAVALLRKDRWKRSLIDAEPMELRSKKTRSEISKAKESMMKAIMQVIEDQAEFLPITDRQIHYRLLNAPPLIHASKPDRYGNTVKCYKSLCELLTRGRLERRIPWNAIEDPTRPVTTWNVYPNVAPYIERETKRLFSGYWRDLMQSQPHHVEIIGEKNTVAGIIRPVSEEFCIPYTIGRGYASLQPRYDLACRFKASRKQKLVLLILSDFDPDGEEIAHSFARSMRDDFGIWNLHPVKVGLTRAQVEAMALIPIMKAKSGSSGFERFTEVNGEDVFELEAVQPKELQRILREAIHSVIDIDALNRELEQEQADQVGLQELKRKMLGAA